MQVRPASDISVFLECPVPHILILERTVSASRAGRFAQGYPSFASRCPGLQVECHAHPVFILALQIQTSALTPAKPVPYAASHLPSPGTFFLFFPLGKGPKLCMEYGLRSSCLAFRGAESLPQSDYGVSIPGTVLWSRASVLWCWQNKGAPELPPTH